MGNNLLKGKKENYDNFFCENLNEFKNSELLEEYYKYKEFLDRVYQPPAENAVYDTDASKNLAPDQKESQNNKKRSADIDADSTKNRSKGGSKAKK